MYGMSKALGRTIRLVAFTLVLVGLAFNIVLIYQHVFKTFQVVQSGSMAPVIKTGDAVLLREVDTKDIKVGQVIVFRDWAVEDQYVIHRVVAIEDNGYTRFFITKGDSNPAVDPVRTPAGKVVGSLWLNFPKLGGLLEYIATPRGFAGTIAAPLLGGLLLVFLQAADEKLLRMRFRKFGPVSPYSA